MSQIDEDIDNLLYMSDRDRDEFEVRESEDAAARVPRRAKPARIKDDVRLFHLKHVERALKEFIEDNREAPNYGVVTVEVAVAITQALTPLRIKAIKDYGRRRRVKVVFL